ncbi:MAG: hypothetical protein R3F17_03385 [Planctomycetota bacterium]
MNPTWSTARTFEDLCHCAAAFLRGELAEFPGWMADETDVETDRLLPALEAACALGFLPLASQPGGCPETSHDGLPWRQRAFLIGFAGPALTERLRGEAALAGLWFRDFAATESGGEELCVAEQGPRRYLWVGQASGPVELEIFQDEIPPAAFAELTAGRYLVLVDPDWGRDDRLWPVLTRLADPGQQP